MKNRTIRSVLLVMGLIGLNITESLAQSNWTRKASLPTARFGLAACALDGKIYALSGALAPAVVTNRVERYDPTTGTWNTKSTKMHEPKTFFAADVLNGNIYVVGGWSTASDCPWNCEAYDPVADTWTSKASLSVGRFGPSAAAVGGKLYVMGGNLLDPVDAATATVEAYDPVANTWSRKKDMPATRSDGACGTVNGFIYFAGGAAYHGGTAQRTVFAYNPTNDTWTTKASMRTARLCLSITVINGKIFAIGGCSDPWNGSPYSSVEAYDPAADKWWLMPSMQVKRKLLATAVVNGKIYAMGGLPQAGFDAPVSSMEEYDPEPTVSLLRSGSTLKVYWNGILETANTVNSTSWQTLNPATWPYATSLAGPMAFFRARQP